MIWKPLSRDELKSTIARELAECSDEQRAYFKRVAFEPTKWSQSPYGDDGGGFWAVAADDNRVVRLRPGEEPEPVGTGIPKARNHNGGRLAFGSDWPGTNASWYPSNPLLGIYAALKEARKMPILEPHRPARPAAAARSRSR